MKNVTLRTIMLKGEAGNSIESIEKIGAEGGVMQMRITFTDGTTHDFPVNDVPDENLIHNIVAEDTQDIRDELEEMTTLKSITLLASNWTGAAPYNYQVAISGIEEGDNYEIIGFEPTNNDNLNASIRESLGYITYGLCSDGEMLFVAVETKPFVDLPIILRKVVGTTGG